MRITAHPAVAIMAVEMVDLEGQLSLPRLDLDLGPKGRVLNPLETSMSTGPTGSSIRN